MTQKEFWEHIEKTKRRDADEHAERLVARLAKRAVNDILDFAHLWDEMLGRAESWAVWGAAYIINGGCSDDGFEYFRGWLILRGRKVYEAALKNPDSLAAGADPDEEFCEFEGRPGWDAWFRATKTENDEAGYDALFAALDARPPRRAVPSRGLGGGWDFDDERKMRKRYPRLWALYNPDENDE
jgi:hypothetical protein